MPWPRSNEETQLPGRHVSDIVPPFLLSNFTLLFFGELNQVQQLVFQAVSNSGILAFLRMASSLNMNPTFKGWNRYLQLTRGSKGHALNHLLVVFFFVSFRWWLKPPVVCSSRSTGGDRSGQHVEGVFKCDEVCLDFLQFQSWETMLDMRMALTQNNHIQSLILRIRLFFSHICPFNSTCPHWFLWPTKSMDGLAVLFQPGVSIEALYQQKSFQSWNFPCVFFHIRSTRNWKKHVQKTTQTFEFKAIYMS